MKKKKITVDYLEAVEHLSRVLDYLHRNFTPNTAHPETKAAIGHWLMNNGKPVPHLDERDVHAAWSALANFDEQFVAKQKVREADFQAYLNLKFNNIPFPPPKNPKFTFIDLFAGIGGFRIAMQELGGKCVFSSDIDKFAQKTYMANFGEMPYGDIKKIDSGEIPNHDILCAGFPCQPFSLAGVSKKNSLGKKHGFEDVTQGTLFFDIARILKEKRPKAFFLENVKNLLTYNKGNTFEIIRKTLEDDLGYSINWKIIDAANWVPQHTERLFLVGYDPRQVGGISKQDIIIPQKPRSGYRYPTLQDIILSDVEASYTIGPGTWKTLQRHKANHAAKGNGFGYGLHKMPIAKNEITRTISARYHKDGAEILIGTKGSRPRRLTVEEAMQLQGYNPTKFVFPVSNTQAYRQIGNSVAIPAIASTAKEITKAIEAKFK